MEFEEKLSEYIIKSNEISGTRPVEWKRYMQMG